MKRIRCTILKGRLFNWLIVGPFSAVC